MGGALSALAEFLSPLVDNLSEWLMEKAEDMLTNEIVMLIIIIFALYFLIKFAQTL